MPNKPKRNYTTDPNKVNKMDHCQTPIYALQPLLEHITCKKDAIIWESAAGELQLLAKGLLSFGFTVIATDLAYGEEYNFFTYQPKRYSIQLTNPPYGIKYLWIDRSFELNKPFALLVPIDTLAALKYKKAKQAAYLRTGIKPVIISPDKRINFYMPNKGSSGTAQFSTVWITWKLLDHKKGEWIDAEMDRTWDGKALELR